MADEFAQGSRRADVLRGMKHGVDPGARITQRWLAEERDARVEAEMSELRAAQRLEAERAQMADGFSEDFDERPPAWDAAW